MRFIRICLGVVAVMAIAAGAAFAQPTSGTITGRIIDSQNLAVPGVTVTVEGTNLQGARSAVTSENGDYILPQLPPGTYTVTFTLSGLGRQQRTIAVAPTQTVPLNVTLGLGGLGETVTVVGKAADVLTQTAQVATNFQQELCGCGGTIFQNGGNGQLSTTQGGSAGESVLTSLRSLRREALKK